MAHHTKHHSTTPERSRLMARVRQAGTAAELTVGRLLRNAGVRYQTTAKGLPGRPDLVGRDRKWVIFVHGCFWHAHAGCKRWKLPKTNRSFWKKKFEENRRRDKRDLDRLRRLGFAALVIWECQLERREELRTKILAFLAQQRATSDRSVDLTFDGPQEEYRREGDSVVRIVQATAHRSVVTRMRMHGRGRDLRSAFDSAYLRKSRRPTLARRRVIRAADLFSGCGGLSLGAMEASRALGRGFISLVALDKDPTCVKVYRQNFRCKNSYSTDVDQILDGRIGEKPTASERHFLRKTKGLTLLLAGPPCEGNSDLNNHTRRKDPRNALYERVARLVELAKPEHVLIENVPAAIHGKEGAVQRSIDVMNRLGYNVDSGVIDLSTLGVPQRRKRHVVVASRSKKLRIADVVKRHAVHSMRSVRWAIGDIQREAANGLFTTPGKHTARNLSRIRFLHNNDRFQLPNRLRPECHKNGGHSYKSMYGRLKFDEPAQTITSGFGSPGQGRFIHPTQLRTITPHEAARLQFFPDFFDFSQAKKRSELASMIGSAAPMKLSYVLCLGLLA